MKAISEMYNVKSKLVAHLRVRVSVAGTKKTESRVVSQEISLDDFDQSLIDPLVRDCKLELQCKIRTQDQWESIIEPISNPDLRHWVASVVWWNYDGKKRTYLWDAMMRYNFDHGIERQKLEQSLKNIGFSSKTSNKVMGELRMLEVKVKEAILSRQSTIKGALK